MILSIIQGLGATLTDQSWWLRVRKDDLDKRSEKEPYIRVERDDISNYSKTRSGLVLADKGATFLIAKEEPTANFLYSPSSLKMVGQGIL